MMKILLAEDTRDLNNAVKAVLEMDKHSVDCAYDGEEALDFILKNGYDVIILDIMMPKKDGLQVLSALRGKNIKTPVIMLTAKAEIEDRVQGLDAGADDYLTKPFAMKELLARVRALARRGGDYGSGELSFGDISVSAQSLELIAENSVRLSMKEFELIQQLILNSEIELDSAHLLEHVWRDEPTAGEDTVWLYVNYLKNKLTAIASSVTISGERGGSYRLTRQTGGI